MPAFAQALKEELSETIQKKASELRSSNFQECSGSPAQRNNAQNLKRQCRWLMHVFQIGTLKSENALSPVASLTKRNKKQKYNCSRSCDSGDFFALLFGGPAEEMKCSPAAVVWRSNTLFFAWIVFRVGQHSSWLLTVILCTKGM